ncbi:MAG: hypothetical protein JWN70_1691 [Planctomycetaceae bacterium]|nr:hypothetical protein [Planctomycetaceae bacterium]
MVTFDGSLYHSFRPNLSRRARRRKPRDSVADAASVCVSTLAASATGVELTRFDHANSAICSWSSRRYLGLPAWSGNVNVGSMPRTWYSVARMFCGPYGRD